MTIQSILIQSTLLAGFCKIGRRVGKHCALILVLSLCYQSQGYSRAINVELLSEWNVACSLEAGCRLGVSNEQVSNILIYPVANQQIFQAHVPLGTALNKPITLTVDGIDEYPLDVLHCNENGCIVYTGLDTNKLKSLARGSFIKIASTHFLEGQRYIYKYQLQGFNGAYARYTSNLNRLANASSTSQSTVASESNARPVVTELDRPPAALNQQPASTTAKQPSVVAGAAPGAGNQPPVLIDTGSMANKKAALKALIATDTASAKTPSSTANAADSEPASNTPAGIDTNIDLTLPPVLIVASEAKPSKGAANPSSGTFSYADSVAHWAWLFEQHPSLYVLLVGSYPSQEAMAAADNVTALEARGHNIVRLTPANGWSLALIKGTSTKRLMFDKKSKNPELNATTLRRVRSLTYSRCRSWSLDDGDTSKQLFNKFCSNR